MKKRKTSGKNHGQRSVKRTIHNKQKLKQSFILLIAGIIFVFISGFYLYKSTIFNKYFSSNTPTASLKLLIFGQINLYYPNRWVPIYFSRNYNHGIYLSDSAGDISELTKCVNMNFCNKYRLMINSKGGYALPTNSNAEDFIRRVIDINPETMQKFKIYGHDAWMGYDDTTHLRHNLIVNVKSEERNTLYVIKASSTSDSEMMEEYVAHLKFMKINKMVNLKSNKTSDRKGFVLKFTSFLDLPSNTGDSSALKFFLVNLLAPIDSRENYDYRLYMTSTDTGDGIISGPDFPKRKSLNSSFYLLTNNIHLREGSYGTSQIKIQLTKSATKDIAGYLTDAKYCVQDSDCAIRQHFCNIGAFNSYHEYHNPYGCGTGGYEILGESQAVLEKYKCTNDFTVEYGDFKCINNGCQAFNPSVICK